MSESNGADVLQRIIEHKLQEIEAAKQQVSQATLQSRLEEQTPPRDFLAALIESPEISLIAEVKRSSPSQGIIRADFDAVEIARQYASAGAACLSVLTDENFFGGKLEFLRDIRNEVSLPLLRKDFVIDPYQVVEARAAGADAVLLIAECLDDASLAHLFGMTQEMGMTPLVELYEPENLERVLRLGPRLVGVNNRNLRTFEVDLQHVVRMRQQIPQEIAVVAESGIFTRQQVRMLEEAGIQAMLVGQSLMEQPDVASATRELLGR